MLCHCLPDTSRLSSFSLQKSPTADEAILGAPHHLQACVSLQVGPVEIDLNIGQIKFGVSTDSFNCKDKLIICNCFKERILIDSSYNKG